MLIKDMKMPKCCLECPFEDSPEFDSYCIAIGNEFIGEWEGLGMYKPDWCPLEEPKTGVEIVPKEESDMYIAGYRDGHDNATKTARWIKGDDYVCDYCGYHMAVGGGVYNYCPSCGKRMLGEDGDEK